MDIDREFLGTRLDMVWLDRPYSLLVSDSQCRFGFDGSDIWIQRRDVLLAVLHTNPRAKFVTRVLQFGSEPLFDDVLPYKVLAQQVLDAKANLSDIGIPVTVSELAWGYQENGGAPELLAALDSIVSYTMRRMVKI